MTEPEEPPAVGRPRPRTRLGWWAAGLALLLTLALGAATVGSGKPLALTILDGLVLVAFAVLAGTYVILTRADRVGRSRSSRADPAGDKAPPRAPQL